MDYILALDQGTTSSRSLIMNRKGDICASAQREFTQIYPQNQWVEHDPEEIWQCQSDMIHEVLDKSGISLEQIKGIGITNQRETTVLWERSTGQSVYNAIVWQCRRTAPLCEELIRQGKKELFRKKTGLPVDAYFSGTKIRWILDNVPGAREKAEAGELCFGTIDSWLIWKLTGGKVHVTDMTNASRTLLFNIHTLDWDEELLDILEIPRSLLPRVRSCSEILGYTYETDWGFSVPIAGVAGDQQSALFGQMCLNMGDVKNTYGTGCFMLMNTGEAPVLSDNGLLTTIAWHLGGRTVYALEGSIFMGGAIVQWLRDNLGIIDSAPECDRLAEVLKSNDGVYLVPAFQGLGTPYWEMTAKAEITGLTRASGKEHICRAALESIAYRSKDVMDIMQKDAGLTLGAIKVDGGASRSDVLMQFQSDLCRTDVIRPLNIETTAMGAAYFAGLAVGFWDSLDEIRRIWKEDRVFTPCMDEKTSSRYYRGWQSAVKKCLEL